MRMASPGRILASRLKTPGAGGDPTSPMITAAPRSPGATPLLYQPASPRSEGSWMVPSGLRSRMPRPESTPIEGIRTRTGAGTPRPIRLGGAGMLWAALWAGRGDDRGTGAGARQPVGPGVAVAIGWEPASGLAVGAAGDLVAGDAPQPVTRVVATAARTAVAGEARALGETRRHRK